MKAHRFAVIDNDGYRLGEGLTIKQAEKIAIRNCGGKRTASDCDGKSFHGWNTVYGYTDGCNGITSIVEEQE